MRKKLSGSSSSVEEAWHRAALASFVMGGLVVYRVPRDEPHIFLALGELHHPA